ncbi:MAG: metallopeptidase family protein [Anaerolineae bacterium]
MPIRRSLFEQMVAEAWEELPARFRDRLDNVVIVVEDFADPETLRLAGLRHPAQLLGLYHGVPLTERTSGYNLVAPDKISLYRVPILQQCNAPGDVGALVRRVLRHEIAHYFGIGDDRLAELGAY